MKGEIGCVVKNSFVSYQRVISILGSFNSSLEDIRLSTKAANRSILGGKRIEDMYPISQPIPLVIGSYRLLYQLLSDIYVISIDIDHHSPFLSLEALNRTKEVIIASMDGEIQFAKVEELKISFYYAFRRCMNGMEGLSVLGVNLRQIRLADDPLQKDQINNAFEECNDVLRPGEIVADARDYTRDAWEAVLHYEARIPNDIKKEIKQGLTSEKFDEYFDLEKELEGHEVPEFNRTPIVEVILEDECDTTKLTEPLDRIEKNLSHMSSRGELSFQPYSPTEIKQASDAVCVPLEDLTPTTKSETKTETVDDDEDEAEEIAVHEEIKVDVPTAKTEAPASIKIETPLPKSEIKSETPLPKAETPLPGKTEVPTAPTEAISDEEGEEESVVVILNGQLHEIMKVEHGVEDAITKKVVKGIISFHLTCPDSITEGTTSCMLTLSNLPGFTITPTENRCVVENEAEGVFTIRVTLPAKTTEENVEVLSYTGSVPDGNVPVLLVAAAARLEKTTSCVAKVKCQECIPTLIEDGTLFVQPPLLSDDKTIKRVFKFKPKGGFLKTSMKCRWNELTMEASNDYAFSADITEPVELGNLPTETEQSFIPCEFKGKFNGILSGVKLAVMGDVDKALHCTYQKNDITADSSITVVYSP